MKVLTVTTRKFQVRYDNTPLEDIMSLLNLRDPEDAPSFYENEIMRLSNEIAILNHFRSQSFTHIVDQENIGWVEPIEERLLDLHADLKEIK